MCLPHHVAVLMGGSSAEREVSLNTGAAVIRGLSAAGFLVKAVDYQGDPAQLQALSGVDLVFIALHGPLGEDGTVQGYLQMLGIPYTGSGVLASALAMDKWRTQALCREAGLRTPQAMYVTTQSDAEILAHLKLPICIKPTREGSSFGITKVTKPAQLRPAIELAQQYGAVMAEQWIEGQEYTVGLVADQALPAICIETPRQFYDYQAKYTVHTTQYHCPSGLNAIDESQVQVLARQAFQCVGGIGWGRVDFMRDAAGDFYLIEVNTAPGLTETSLVPKAAKQYGWSFEVLLSKIIQAVPHAR